MRVIKRHGQTEEVEFDKITHRLRTLCDMEPPISGVDISRVAQHACASMYDMIPTETLDHITADASVALATEHPGYSVLAARILVSNMHKSTNASVRDVYANLRHAVSNEFWNVVDMYADQLDAMMDFSRDYLFDYFGFKTMTKSYVLEGERPQHVYIRVAVGIWGYDMERVKDTYEALSLHLFTHASPTLFNAGTKSPQLASCYLLGIHTDSLDSIFETLHKAAAISKYGGGIGLHVHSVRSKGSLIRGTNGKSDGLVPLLKVANEVFRYVNQSGRRKGSCAIYIEPHHADILSVLDLKRNQGDEHLRARDLFYAMWISDLFMKRVEANEQWSLFDPNTAPGLENVYGDDYEALYCKYEAQGKAIRQLPAQEIWFAILRSQIETGVPYMVYKDAVNTKSNQKNLGTIKSSNLCVAPETLILTTQGHVRIHTKVNQEVEVWNGKEWSKVTVRQTHDDAQVLKVVFDDHTVLECTPYHKFYLNSTRCVEAQDLSMGDILLPWTDPISGKIVRHTVERVEWTDRCTPTYCFTEPRRAMGVFNGVLTGNCSEIVEYTGENEIAVCNIGSMSLPAFVRDDGTYDYEGLHAAVKILARNLDKIIDVTFYPVLDASYSNLSHRPIGIGVQGLADTFFKLRMPYDSEEARDLNRKIFATIYHAAVETSCDIAAERQSAFDAGLLQGPVTYSSFPGSPASLGILQPDLWGIVPDPMYDWDLLRARAKMGMRNSLLVAPMPTASTGQLLGNTECFEPITSNLYSRTTLAGTFTVVNTYLLKDLIRLSLWTPELKQQLVTHEGSVQRLDIPDTLKKLYKTAYEMSMKTLIDLAADRGPYVDQSMSLNMFMAEPTFRKLSSMHFYAWKQGLKTGMYYLRSKPASGATKITVEKLAETDCVACSG